MPQHKDRLSPVDASFLAQEKDAAHMHVGAVMIFEGPPPGYDEFAEQVESRMHLVPRYRQKLAFPRFEMGRPLWVDDPSFNLEYHVRNTALPRPGSIDQLHQLTARIFSQRLDRSKPLWETWLVQGLEKNRFALISKTHHSLIDGVAGVDLASVLFDLSPVPSKVDPEPWTPHPEPTDAELVAEGVKGLVRRPFSLAGQALQAVQKPGRTLSTVRESTEALGEVVWAGMNPAPEVPLNVAIGPHRRLQDVRVSLEDFKAVKRAFGGTVNDVVLAVVAGALRRWLRSRGVGTEGMELVALVPMSIRSEEGMSAGGEPVPAMRRALPGEVAGPGGGARG